MPCSSPYACPECPKRFTTHYSHKIHIRSHTKEKPYLCSDCGKRFTSSGKLLVHKRIHTGSRPYKCDVCSATFVDSSNLKRHSKIHTTSWAQLAMRFFFKFILKPKYSIKNGKPTPREKGWYFFLGNLVEFTIWKNIQSRGNVYSLMDCIGCNALYTKLEFTVWPQNCFFQSVACVS